MLFNVAKSIPRALAIVARSRPKDLSKSLKSTSSPVSGLRSLGQLLLHWGQEHFSIIRISVLAALLPPRKIPGATSQTLYHLRFLFLFLCLFFLPEGWFAWVFLRFGLAGDGVSVGVIAAEAFLFLEDATFIELTLISTVSTLRGLCLFFVKFVFLLVMLEPDSFSSFCRFSSFFLLRLFCLWVWVLVLLLRDCLLWRWRLCRRRFRRESFETTTVLKLSLDGVAVLLARETGVEDVYTFPWRCSPRCPLSWRLDSSSSQ